MTPEPTKEEYFLCALRNSLLPPEFCKGTMDALEEIIEKQRYDNRYNVVLTCGCEGFYQLFGVHRPGCPEAF